MQSNFAAHTQAFNHLSDITLQDDFDKAAAQHLALAASNLTAKPGSSVQHAENTRSRSANMAQVNAVQPDVALQTADGHPQQGQQVLALSVLHASHVPSIPCSNMFVNSCNSMRLARIVYAANAHRLELCASWCALQGHPARPAHSRHSNKSDSSSEPSDEMLDDPTHIALSQRPHAHLPAQPQVMPHGDAMTEACHANGRQLDAAAEAEALLPTRQMPRTGQWMSKQGRTCFKACYTCAAMPSPS